MKATKTSPVTIRDSRDISVNNHHEQQKSFDAFLCISLHWLASVSIRAEYSVSEVCLWKCQCLSLGYNALNIRIVIIGEFDSVFIRNVNTRYRMFHSRTYFV